MKRWITFAERSWPFLLGLLIGLLVYVFNVLGFNFSYLPGDFGDGRFNLYILEHCHQFFTGAQPSLWDAPFMFPEAETITYSDNLLGSAPIYSLFRLIGFNTYTAYQWWFTSIAILNYGTCYAFLKWCFKNRYVAVLGAFVFAFSIALQSQMTHAQVFPRFFIPLAFWALMAYKQSLSPRLLFLAVLMLVLQFYCGIYLGLLASIPFAIIFSVVLVQQRKLLLEKIREFKWILYSLIGVVANLLFLLLLMIPYYLRSKEVLKESYDVVLGTVPTIRSFLYSQPGSLLWDSLSTTGQDYPAFWDHQLFPGALALLSVILVIITLFMGKKWHLAAGKIKEHSPLLIAAGLTFVFFIRFKGISLYSLLYELPGFNSMRSITRVINVELLFFAFAIAFAAWLLFQRLSKYTVILFIVGLGLLTVDNFFIGEHSYRMEKADAKQRTDELISKMRHVPQGALISYEPEILDDYPIFYQIDAMLASQSLGLKCVNVYTGHCPPGLNKYWWELNEAGRIEWFEAMNFTPNKLYVIK